MRQTLPCLNEPVRSMGGQMDHVNVSPTFLKENAAQKHCLHRWPRRVLLPRLSVVLSAGFCNKDCLCGVGF